MKVAVTVRVGALVEVGPAGCSGVGVELGTSMSIAGAAVGPARAVEGAGLQPACAHASNANPIPILTGGCTVYASIGGLVVRSAQEVFGAAVLAAEHALAGEADLTTAVLAALQVADVGSLG